MRRVFLSCYDQQSNILARRYDYGVPLRFEVMSLVFSLCFSFRFVRIEPCPTVSHDEIPVSGTKKNLDYCVRICALRAPYSVQTEVLTCRVHISLFHWVAAWIARSIVIPMSKTMPRLPITESVRPLLSYCYPTCSRASFSYTTLYLCYK